MGLFQNISKNLDFFSKNISWKVGFFKSIFWNFGFHSLFSTIFFKIWISLQYYCWKIGQSQNERMLRNSWFRQNVNLNLRYCPISSEWKSMFLDSTRNWGEYLYIKSKIFFVNFLNFSKKTQSSLRIQMFGLKRGPEQSSLKHRKAF